MFLSERTVAPYRLRHGNGALLVSMPHVGTFVPHSVGHELSDCAVRRADTDWHLPRLYDFLEALDATVIAATHSRYVIDANRPPDGANLYPGRDTPKLCPTDTFAREPLYRRGEPTPSEIARRLQAIWHPYHARLDRELARLRELHGTVVLWDAHSIVSVEPRLFEGRLPDFNLGTAGGASCDRVLAEELVTALQRHPQYTHVLDGRFQGGYITRHYGNPSQGLHAIQLEMAEAVYMEEKPPYAFREDLAARVRPILRELLEVAIGHAGRSTSPGPRALVR